MPIRYARRLTGRKRSTLANRQLGVALAFIAGATNAGGFLAVQQYTSHMTGIVSAMADHIALGAYGLVWSGLGGVLSFLLGAIGSSVLINYARRRRLHSEYALPLLLEAFLLLCFGFLGASLAAIEGFFVPLTVMLLCFIMGLQNALITKLSHAEIRTTHITGIVTDIGIELGKLLYWNRRTGGKLLPVLADRERLRVLSLLALGFFFGGLTGAFGFKHLGYISTVPLALLLVSLASVPALDDLHALFKRTQRP
ncbi:YoaK family protein [Pseudomonas sp.]|uniref:YoaK family protein n=1 Tax=Pseudomonas sp. TaxID=306 RepID=UPI003523FE48